MHASFSQPFLSANFQVGTITTGAMFMLDGAVYTIFSPCIGWLLDHKVKPYPVIFVGILGLVLGYLVLGPAYFLDFLPKSIVLVGLGLAIHG